MNLNSYTLYIPFSNFETQEVINLFLTGNLFDYCIDYQYYHISAISKIDYKEKILVTLNEGLLCNNKNSYYSIKTDEFNLIIEISKNIW
jgi:hypothetical protein